ncbi:MAG: hypothetical protein KDD69_15765 [Bdellovibrionales bacterium]|nr:hypothetical protein [Bdellovibrionales bacterium]
MRMFLVGMCDIFLILYLTTLTRVSPFPASALTVDDYRALEEAKRALEDEHTQTSASLEQLREELTRERERAEALELAKLELASEREAALEADAQSDREAELLHEELSRIRTLRTEQEAELQRAIAELERTQAEARMQQDEIARFERKQLAADSALAEQQALLTAANASAHAAEQQMREYERLMDESRQRERQAASEALAAAEAARAAELTAREAEAEAAAAKAAEAEALARASASASQKEQAIALARYAASQAVTARETAAAERKRAKIAEARKRETQQELQAVTQPADTAFERNVKTKAESMVFSVQREALFGTTREKQSFSGIPVRHGRERVVILSRNQLRAFLSANPDEYERLDIRIGSQAVTRAYVRPNKPKLVAFVLPSSGPAADLVSGPLRSTEVMPTLIAVRSNTNLGLIDSLRDVSEDYFVLKRDQLEEQGGMVRYSTSGLRGTGDFAEYLVPGDQIVDLQGNLLGITTDDNLATRITSLTGWIPITLTGRPTKEIVQDLR